MAWWRPFGRKTPKGASAPPATAELQDPLPEPKWFWRRVLVFLTALVVSGLIWRVTENIADLGRTSPPAAVAAIGALASIIRYLVILLVVDRVLYLVAPSADQLGVMIGKLWAGAKGLSLHSRAAAEGPQGSAETETTITPAATAPPAPTPATKPPPLSPE